MSLEGVKAHWAKERAVVAVEGADAQSFLQGLLTNDMTQAAPDRLLYAALLTPQGKFLVDALIDRPEPGLFRLDVRAEDAAPLVKRLFMYKLRAQVALSATDLSVVLLWRTDGAPLRDDLGFADPRAPELGRRMLVDAPDEALARLIADGASDASRADYDSARIAAVVPEAPLDLTPNDAFPLEYDFERLRGVDFRKGCYVGQEVTARMKHKATLKKRLVQVAVGVGELAEDREVRLADGRPAGRIGSVVGNRGLALLRIDRIAPGLVCGAASIDPLEM